MPSRGRKPVEDKRLGDQSINDESPVEKDPAAEAPKPRRRRSKAAETEGVEKAAKTEKPGRRRSTQKTKPATPEPDITAESTKNADEDASTPHATDNRPKGLVPSSKDAPTASEVGPPVPKEARQPADTVPEMTDAKSNNADKASSTVVINVGEQPAKKTNPRRGWWSRP